MSKHSLNVFMFLGIASYMGMVGLFVMMIAKAVVKVGGFQ